jgi:hypothetical protein
VGVVFVPWVNPSSVVAGVDELTAARWNQDVVANTDYLKAEADAVGLVHIATLSDPSISEIIFDDVFTSAFTNYKVVAKLQPLSSSSPRFVFRDGSGNLSTNYYASGIGALYTASTTVYMRTSNNATTVILGGADSTQERWLSMDIFSPQQNAYTGYTGQVGERSLGYAFHFGGQHDVVGVVTGIRFFAASGNINATISIYGYKES